MSLAGLERGAAWLLGRRPVVYFCLLVNIDSCDATWGGLPEVGTARRRRRVSPVGWVVTVPHLCFTIMIFIIKHTLVSYIGLLRSLHFFI